MMDYEPLSESCPYCKALKEEEIRKRSEETIRTSDAKDAVQNWRRKR